MAIKVRWNAAHRVSDLAPHGGSPVTWNPTNYLLFTIYLHNCSVLTDEAVKHIAACKRPAEIDLTGYELVAASICKLRLACPALPDGRIIR